MEPVKPLYSESPKLSKIQNIYADVSEITLEPKQNKVGTWMKTDSYKNYSDEINNFQNAPYVSDLFAH